MLSCDFDVESDQLLSLKWYKDGHEFFRYFMHPGARMQTFPVDGVHVDVSYSFVLRFALLRYAHPKNSKTPNKMQYSILLSAMDLKFS